MKLSIFAAVILALCAANAVQAQNTTNSFPTTGAFLTSGPKGLTFLQKALAAANLTAQIAKFNGTVLMPTDTAFINVLEDMNVTEKELLSHREALTALLLYHVSVRLVPDLKTVRTLPMALLNKTLNVTTSNGSSFLEGDYNAAKVVGTTFVGTGAVPTTVLYTIDTVLVPDLPDNRSSSKTPPPARNANFTGTSPPPVPIRNAASSLSAACSHMLLLLLAVAALLS